MVHNEVLRSGGRVDSTRVVATRVCDTTEPADDAAFAATITAHVQSVWRFLTRLGVPAADVDDATQEVILVAARKRRDIAAGSERAFLMSTAFHVARRVRETRVRRAEVTDDELEILCDAGPDPESSAALRQERAVLDAILMEMPLDLRAVFVLFELEEQSTQEIATVLDIPAGTVASRLRRARADFEARVSRLELRTRSMGGRR